MTPSHADPRIKTSKSGVLGLTRSLAASFPATHGIRVNGVCPSVTATPLSALHVLPIFESLKLPINSSLDVARQMAGLCCDHDMNGKILYVEGGQSWDIEEGLAETRPQWLGASVLDTLDKITRHRTSVPGLTP
jgi:NAD(P)-dependent dehydrogenase (short-subunit alcohol dehydrogenase family)